MLHLFPGVFERQVEAVVTAVRSTPLHASTGKQSTSKKEGWDNFAKTGSDMVSG
jgi:hypothetical protein